MLLAKFLLNYLFLKDYTVIIDLLGHKSIYSSVISHCYDDITTILVHRFFYQNNLRISDRRVDKNKSATSHLYERLGVVVNTSCEGWNNMFGSVGDYPFKTPYVWIIFTENLNETSNVLSRYKIEMDSDVTVISKNENVYDLYETYHTGFHKRNHFIVRKVGNWQKSLHIESKSRMDLKGLVLRSTVVIPQSQRVGNRTFVRFLEEEQPNLIKVDPMHKFKYYAALKYFRDMFNITYEFQRTHSWGYGTNGTFDGLVGALQRMETDIGGSPLFIRADRSKAVDYAAECWPTKPCFIFRHPKHPGGVYNIYTRPLTTTVWYCIIALMTLSTVVLGVLLNLDIIKVSGDDDVSPSLAFLLIWSAICQQGMTVSRNSTSVKMVVFVTFLFALTIYQYYNATVVSTLLRESPKNIRTSKDLLKSNLAAGVEDILYNKDYFMRTTDPIAREIYLKKVAYYTPHNYLSAEQGMAMVKKGGFAFHIDKAVAYRIIRRTFSEKELCELQEVVVFAPSLGVAVAKRSPYKELVAFGMRKMKESGVLARLLSLWDEARPACVKTPDSSVFAVSIKEFSTALILLMAGYLAAVVVLTGEVLIWRIERRKTIAFRH